MEDKYIAGCDPYNDNAEVQIFLKSQFGCEFANPVSFCYIEMKDCEYKRTWAEKKRDELIWRWKSRIALRNKFIVGLIMAALVAAVLVGLIALAVIFPGSLVPIASAYLASQLVRLAFLILTERIPCDPNDIHLKR